MDTIANMLNTIGSSQKVGKKRVEVPYSRFKESLARLLQERGLIANFRVQEGTLPKLIISLAYAENGDPRIHGLRRMSTPGRRMYVSKSDIPYSLDGIGTYILSTSQGLMVDSQARKQGMGGELVCEIW